MRAWIRQLIEGGPLTAAEAEAAFGTIVAGKASPVEVSAFLAGIGARGETAAEVAGGVRALRRVMVELSLPADRLVDTCGTGGGSFTTFNISTVAALVAAGGGVAVAKHGNRSFTSRCGSADLLETLGVRIELPHERLPQVFDRAGLIFMYAPRHHPAMRHVAAVRQELAAPTIMNLLGPLTSPARVRRQVVGVSEPGLIALVADALRVLEHERALVVHGQPGLDELSPVGETRGLRLDGGTLEEFRVRPEDFGWSELPAEELAGGGPAENAALAREILAGERGGAARAAVELNAAAAFWVGGAARDLEEGVHLAAKSLDGGAALDALERLRMATARAAAAEAGGGD